MFSSHLSNNSWADASWKPPSTCFGLLWEAMAKGEEGVVGILYWVAREEEGSGGSTSTNDKRQERKE